MNRRQFLAGATALGAAGVLSRPALAQSDARILHFVPESNLATPDPVWNVTHVTRNHGMMVWDMLYGLDTNFEPQPQMAAGHELSGDRLTWRFTLRDEGDVVTVECDEKKSGVALLSAARLWIGKGCPMVEVECSNPDRQTLVDMILASAKVSYPEPLETGRLTARQIIHETLADLPDRRWWLSDFRERYVDSRDDAVNAALLREVNARIIHLRCQIPTDEHDSARALQARGASVARALSAEAGPAGSKSAEARPVEVKPADSKPAGISDTAPASPTLPAISPISPSPAPRAPSPLPSLSPSLW